MRTTINLHIPKSKQDAAQKFMDYCDEDNIEKVTKYYNILGPKYKQFYSYVFTDVIWNGSSKCIKFFLDKDLIFNIWSNRPLELAIIMDNIDLVEQLLTKMAVLKTISNWMLSSFFRENEAYIKFISCDAAQKCMNIEIIRFYMFRRSADPINAIKISVPPSKIWSYNDLFEDAMPLRCNNMIRAILNLNFPDKIEPQTFRSIMYTTALPTDLPFYEMLLNSNKITSTFINTILLEFMERYYMDCEMLQVMMYLAQYVDGINYRTIWKTSAIDRILKDHYQRVASKWYRPYKKEFILQVALNNKFNYVYYQTLTIISALNDVYYFWGIPREIMMRVIYSMNLSLFTYWEAVY